MRKKAYILVIDRDSAHDSAGLAGFVRRSQREAGLENMEMHVTDDPTKASAFAENHDCPIVFMNADDKGMDVFSLTRRIRGLNDHTNFILMTERRETIMRALQMRLRLSGYIFGTPDEETITDLLCNLWYPLEEAAE